MKIELNDVERDMILGALRLWQHTPKVPDEIMDIATNCSHHDWPLDDAGIDDLCERLNLGDPAVITPQDIDIQALRERLSREFMSSLSAMVENGSTPPAARIEAAGKSELAPTLPTDLSGAHTAGPWEVQWENETAVWIDGDAGGQRHVPVLSPDGFHVARVQCDEDDPEQAHNALLIAQAPSLLAALGEVTRCLAWHITNRGGVGMDGEAVRNALNVLSAAKGPRA